MLFGSIRKVSSEHVRFPHQIDWQLTGKSCCFSFYSYVCNHVFTFQPVKLQLFISQSVQTFFCLFELHDALKWHQKWQTKKTVSEVLPWLNDFYPFCQWGRNRIRSCRRGCSSGRRCGCRCRRQGVAEFFVGCHRFQTHFDTQKGPWVPKWAALSCKITGAGRIWNVETVYNVDHPLNPQGMGQLLNGGLIAWPIRWSLRAQIQGLDSQNIDHLHRNSKPRDEFQVVLVNQINHFMSFCLCRFYECLDDSLKKIIISVD